MNLHDTQYVFPERFSLRFTRFESFNFTHSLNDIWNMLHLYCRTSYYVFNSRFTKSNRDFCNMQEYDSYVHLYVHICTNICVWRKIRWFRMKQTVRCRKPNVFEHDARHGWACRQITELIRNAIHLRRMHNVSSGEKRWLGGGRDHWWWWRRKRREGLNVRKDTGTWDTNASTRGRARSDHRHSS